MIESLDGDTTMKIDIECGDIILFSRPCMSMDLSSAFVCLGAKIVAFNEIDHVGIGMWTIID